MWRLWLILAAAPAWAESVVATRPIRAHALITTEDVTVVDADIEGAATSQAQVVGLEARVAIYPGRPVRMADLGAAATIERNQIVSLAYRTGALAITAEGRALDRGGVGDVIRVMNLSSRTTVTGQIGSDGQVNVGPQP